MKVAYVFSAPNAHYILSNMIVPQLEKGAHGFDVAGMFFFVDNTFMLAKGSDVGERLAKIAAKTGMLLMACDKRAIERKVAEDMVSGATIGCFPDLRTKRWQAPGLIRSLRSKGGLMDKRQGKFINGKRK